VADDPRVQQLLNKICDSGYTPEEVCADCPELLPEVRRRWRRMRSVEGAARFPVSAGGARLPLGRRTGAERPG
jgi:serine/threonine-protein kinase